MQSEYLKGIFINLIGDDKERGCHVLARHGPIGTGTISLQIIPRMRKNVNTVAGAGIIERGGQFAVEQFGEEGGIVGNDFEDLCFLFGGEGGKNKFNLVRSGARAGYVGDDDIVLDFDIADGSLVSVGFAPRQSAGVVNIFECVEKLFAPIGIAVRFSHKV